ncbi:Hypothetical predicted protein [Scomber scombrus]|uniref:Uncharacterized protein n=1 Tax=Scomber scombrus TaxID=13677 RepID=A0AAV1P9Z2_SCOSC
MSNHLCSCCENSTLPLLQQTLLPHQSFSPLSDSRITSAHYLMARSESCFFRSCFTDPPWPHRRGQQHFHEPFLTQRDSHVSSLCAPL